MADLENPYKTADMLEALRLLREPRTFLTKTFFSKAHTSRQAQVKIDITKGARTVGAVVRRGEGAIQIDRPVFTTSSYEPPEIPVMRTITDSDLVDRLPGQTQYDDTDRASELQAQDLFDLNGIIDRTIEAYAAEALFSGTITLKDKENNTVGDILDFQRNSENMPAALSGSAVWTNAASQPNAQFINAQETIDKNGDIMSDICIMGRDAFKAFFSNPDVREQMKQGKYPDEDRLVREARELGAIYRGYYSGHEIYTYNGWYKDLAGNIQTLVPVNKVLWGARTAYTRLLFGALLVESTNGQSANLVAVDKYPDSWVQKNPIGINVRVRSKPLPVPHQTDAFYVQQVV